MAIYCRFHFHLEEKSSVLWTECGFRPETEAGALRETLEAFCARSGQSALLDEWDRERNLPLTPGTVTRGSHKKAFWRCKYGHSWQAAVYSRADGSGCPVCHGRRVGAGFNDLLSSNPALARQWDTEKNAPLTPRQVSAGSHQTVWWRCEHGHSWQASIRARVSGSGCPVCAGRQLLTGENDLAARFPLIAAEWDTEKNGVLTPDQIVSGSSRRIWWRCARGHSWLASVRARTSNANGCPVCAGKQASAGFNDLASRCPQLAAEWDTEKNGALTPKSVTPGSNRKVFWRCAHGHSYAAKISARTKCGTGCPYCAGRKVLEGFNDLQTVFPKLAAEWHPTLNGTLTPRQVTSGSNKRVWWQCPLGHVWKAVVYSRTGPRPSGCPVCAGKTRPPKRVVHQKSNGAAVF